MPRVEANGIEIEYDRSGPADGAPFLLVHGLSAQLTQWPHQLIDALCAAGFSVIRYDSRDVGLSTRCDDTPIPDIAAAVAARRRGEKPDLPYHVDDLADDAVGLLDALGIGSAHVAGLSLGGLVVQALAINHPHRVRSLDIVMSYSGNPETPPTSPNAMTPLPDPAEDEEGYVDGQVVMLEDMGSPGYPWIEEELRAFVRDAVRRAYYPAGVARQFAAARSVPDRRPGLNRLTMPTLVIHGTDDPRVPHAAGEDIARNIPGSMMLTIRGMGHDLPPQLGETLAAAFVMNARRG